MKAKKSLILSLTGFFLASCGGSTPTPVAEDKVNLFTAYSHENLLRDHDYWNEEGSTYKDRGSTLKFEGLKNENDAFQLVMYAKRDITSYNLVINDDIVDSKGNKYSKDNFSVYSEWYQFVSSSKEPGTLCERGYYPDALIPIDKLIARQKDYIQKGRNQALYINTKIPSNQAAGEYNGTATLTVDGYNYTVPINVKVHDVTLSDANHVNSCFLIWYSQIPIGEKSEIENMDEAYFDTVVSKRICPDQLPSKYTLTPEAYANAIAEKIALNDKISQTRFPVSDSTFSQSRVESYMNGLKNKFVELAKKGQVVDLFKKIFFYVTDEPSSEKFDHVREVDKTIYDIKVKYSKDEAFKDYPEIQQSILKMKNIVTTSYTSELIATEDKGGVQTWCPQFQFFNTQEQRDEYKARQKSQDRSCGENVWWYGCESPRGTFPSYHLDAVSAYGRILPYMTFNYGVEGYLYWCVNFYQTHQKGTDSGRDIWYDANTWEGTQGDGCLLYPASEFNCSAPLSTLRFENILAGNEEYEYLYMLDKKVGEYNAAHPELETPYVLNDLLAKEYAKMYTGVVVNRIKKDSMQVIDTKVVYDLAHTLLNALDAFNVSLDKGMEFLKDLAK